MGDQQAHRAPDEQVVRAGRGGAAGAAAATGRAAHRRCSRAAVKN